MSEKKTNLVIIGAGKGGTALLEIFKESKTINILGIVDSKEDSPGLNIAKELGIPTASNFKKFLDKKDIRERLDEIINVTGSEDIQRKLQDIKPSDVEIIGGISAKLMWNIIEEHEALERELDKKTKFLNTVIESLSHPFYVVDTSDYSVLFANETALKGRALGETTCYALIHQRNEPCSGEHTCPIDEVKRTKKSVTVTHRNYDKDGNERYVQVTGFPIFDDEGNVTQMIEYSIDITKRRRAEKAFRESEARLSQIVQRSSIPTFVIDHNHITTHWNMACEKVTGIPADEIVGTRKQWRAFYPEARPVMADIVVNDKLKENLERYYVGKWKKSSLIEDAYEAEDFFPQMGKGGKWFFFTAVPLKDDEEKVVGSVETLQDITERKQAEKALKESEGKLNAMLNSIGDHMSMMDKDLNILWANTIAKEIFGEDIIGKKCYEVYHRRKDPCEPYPCLTLKAFKDGMTHEHDTTVTSKDGRKVYFHCTANVSLRDEEGNPTAVLEISRDITERKQAEEKLKANLAELEKMNKIMFGREKRILELKQEVNTLLEKSSKEPKYAG